jgi:hypothetical protein
MLTRTHGKTSAPCPCGCGTKLKANQKYAMEACRKRASRAGKSASTCKNCRICGGWRVSSTAFICATCGGNDPSLRVSPRAEGHPRLFYGYMVLPSREVDGKVQVFTGDTDVKPVLRAMTEAMGGIYQDDAVVLMAMIPVEGLKADRQVAA